MFQELFISQVFKKNLCRGFKPRLPITAMFIMWYKWEQRKFEELQTGTAV